MKIQSVQSPAFQQYGKILEGDFTDLLEALKSSSPCPPDSVVYVPHDEALGRTAAAKELQYNVYGGMPIQMGYCNGHNRSLNCLEYHRGSEVNVAADDVVLLLAPLQKVANNRLDTGEIEAFLVPAGTAVLLYETSLHYAPCTADGGVGFRVVIVLPAGTNTAKPSIAEKTTEDQLLWAANKWLLAHPDAPEAAQGAYAGLTGPNIVL